MLLTLTYMDQSIRKRYFNVRTKYYKRRYADLLDKLGFGHSIVIVYKLQRVLEDCVDMQTRPNMSQILVRFIAVPLCDLYQRLVVSYKCAYI